MSVHEENGTPSVKEKEGKMRRENSLFPFSSIITLT
jgi:hypothetical protein